MPRFDRSRPFEAHWRARHALRWVALVLTCVGIILSGLGLGFAWTLLIPLGLSFIWNIANIARRLSAHTPIHPGANVGLDLFIVLAFLITLGFTYYVAIAELLTVAEEKEDSYYYDYGSYGGCSEIDSFGNCIDSSGDYYGGGYGYYYDSDFWDTITRISNLAVAAAAISTVVMIFHLTLFILACIDTHRYRHSDRYPAYARDVNRTGAGNFNGMQQVAGNGYGYGSSVQQGIMPYPTQGQYAPQGQYPPQGNYAPDKQQYDVVGNPVSPVQGTGHGMQQRGGSGLSGTELGTEVGSEPRTT